jgi:uncharacterized membrane protein HdeD (DUF308 family)
MNQKQLADVLIKILGLSSCVQGVMHIASGIFSLLEMLSNRGNVGNYFLWVNILTGLILAAIGVFFILQSRLVSDKLFKDE